MNQVLKITNPEPLLSPLYLFNIIFLFITYVIKSCVLILIYDCPLTICMYILHENIKYPQNVRRFSFTLVFVTMIFISQVHNNAMTKFKVHFYGKPFISSPAPYIHIMLYFEGTEHVHNTI